MSEAKPTSGSGKAAFDTVLRVLGVAALGFIAADLHSLRVRTEEKDAQQITFADLGKVGTAQYRENIQRVPVVGIGGMVNIYGSVEVENTVSVDAGRMPLAVRIEEVSLPYGSNLPVTMHSPLPVTVQSPLPVRIEDVSLRNGSELPVRVQNALVPVRVTNTYEFPSGR